MSFHFFLCPLYLLQIEMLDSIWKVWLNPGSPFLVKNHHRGWCWCFLVALNYEVANGWVNLCLVMLKGTCGFRQQFCNPSLVKVPVSLVSLLSSPGCWSLPHCLIRGWKMVILLILLIYSEIQFVYPPSTSPKRQDKCLVLSLSSPILSLRNW